MMKNILYLLIISVLALGFVACAEDDDKDHYFEQGWHLKLRGYKKTGMTKMQAPRPAADYRYFRMTCRTDGDVHGRGEENIFTAKYSINGNRIQYTEVKSSSVESEYEDEKAALGLLRQVTKFKYEGKFLFMYVQNEENLLMYERFDVMKDIKSSKYALPEGYALKASAKEGEVYRANSVGELGELLEVTGEEAQLPEVDFEKQMVLLVNVRSSNKIKEIKSELAQIDHRYEWSLFVVQDDAEVASVQTMAIVTDKLAESEKLSTDIVYSLPVNR